MNATAAKIAKTIRRSIPAITALEVFQHEGRWIAQYETATTSGDLFIPAAPAAAARKIAAQIAAK